jgi:hypothetical protein
MADMEKPRFVEFVEARVASMGGRVKGGIVSKEELEHAPEIRVSIRLPWHIGSTELFTLRNIPPADYHLLLIAIPRRGSASDT